MKLGIAVTLALFLTGPVGAECPVADTPAPDDKAHAIQVSDLYQLWQCEQGNQQNDFSPCNFLAVKGIKLLYGVDTLSKNGSPMTANETADALESGFDGWSKLGEVLSDENGACAQSLANTGNIVIAVWRNDDEGENEGMGHIALVIPGTTSVTGWGVAVPNSAAFSFSKANGPNTAQTYVGKPLSLSFSKAKAATTVYYYYLKSD